MTAQGFEPRGIVVRSVVELDVLDPVVRPEEPVLDGQGVVPDMKQMVIARGIGGKTVRTDIRTEAQGIGIAGACVMIEEEIGAIPEVKYIGVIARSADQSVIADTAAQNVIPPVTRESVISLARKDQVCGGCPRQGVVP